MDYFKKYNLLLNLQIAFAFIISVFISYSLGLQNYVTAGVITLLSIQDTKKKTIETAIKRFLGFIIMLVFVYIIFNLFGYSIITFGVFVLLFSLINSRLEISIGLAPNVVMASHFFLRNSTSLSFIWNETLIYMIGLLMAVIVNLIIPIINKRDINKIKLDNYIKDLLMYISNILSEKYINEEKKRDRETYIKYVSKKINETNTFIDSYENEIKTKLENILFNNNIYDLEYVNLRRKQYKILIKIFNHSKRINRKLEHTQKISEFIEEIYFGYYETNTALDLIRKCHNLLTFFESQELPQTREEFENRANLYIILEDLSDFLHEKYKFSREII